MRVELTIPGEPQGKARAKIFRNKNGAAHGVTPDSTVLYENLIKLTYGKRPLLDGPIGMELTAFYRVPKSASKANKVLMTSGALRPCKKPDTDNIIKVVSDALNGHAYRDDAQVVEVTAVKLYCPEGVEPCVHVALWKV